jgi:hypothetical protein
MIQAPPPAMKGLDVMEVVPIVDSILEQDDKVGPLVYSMRIWISLL